MAHSVREQNGASKSVYRLRLNIGLVGNPLDGLSDPVIFANIGRDLRTAFLPFLYKAHADLRPETSILVMHCEGTEPTIYVEFDVNAGRPLEETSRAVAGMVACMSSFYTQEAIAWTLSAIQSQSDTQQGETIQGIDGPLADAWRPFNPAYFVTLETPVDPSPLWAHV